jgi:AraC-like DNA-binding protein
MYFNDYPIISSESNLPLYLVSVGLHDCQPHTLREEGFSHPQILYCTKGSGTLAFDGYKYTIKPYMAFFLPAGCPHEYWPEEDIWDIHWVVPAGFAVNELLYHFNLDKPRVFELGDTRTLEHHFRKLHDTLMGDRIFGNYRAAGFLYDFLIEFYRLTSAINTGIAANSAVVRAIDYINAHYTEEITMEQLCACASVSKQHLCRLFQSALHSRPMEYIAKRRIQAAKELLSNTDTSIETIAEETGFCTSSYFCKLFKRYEGMTPTQFRRG